MLFDVLIKAIAQFKVYAVRSQQYAGIVMLFIQVSLFIAINVQLELVWWQYIVVFVVSAILFVFTGFLDVKFGVLGKEQKFYGDNNPIYDEIFKRLERIERKC